MAVGRARLGPPARAARRLLIACALPLLLSPACAGPATPADIGAATRLEAGGETDAEALAAWTRIAEARCPARRAAAARSDRTLDRAADETVRKDDCGVALLRRGQLLERLGRSGEAVEVYEAAAAEGAGPREAARALAEAARLREAQGDRGAIDLAIADCERAVSTYPGELGADDALERWLRLARRRGDDLRALRDRLDALAVTQAQSDAVDNLLFAAGDLSDRDLHDARGAVVRWDELARRFPRSSLRDDALWRAAALLRQGGDPRGALVRLEGILATRRSAWITGSYNSVLLDDAQLLHGRILLDDLAAPREAARDFERLADDYTESVLRDDALFALAQAREAQGDRAAACAALSRIEHDFPDGNRVRDANHRRAQLACPGRTGAP